MRSKCKRCERACHSHDKIVYMGIKCCTDCKKEITTPEAEALIKGIINSSLTINEITENNKSDIRLYASDGAGLTVCAEFSFEERRLAISDVTKDDNFAIMYPKKGNINSFRCCFRLCMDEIIQNADD